MVLYRTVSIYIYINYMYIPGYRTSVCVCIVRRCEVCSKSLFKSILMYLLRMTTLPHSPIDFGSKSIEYVVLLTNQWDSGSLSSRCVGTSCKNQCPKVCVWTGRSGLAMNYKIRLRDY